MRTLIPDRRATTSFEYVLIASLIAVAVFGAARLIGPALIPAFSNVTVQL